MKLQMCAPCHFGLEKTLSFEVRRAGGENITALDGRVFFTGDERVLIRANLSLSAAERVGLILADFEARTFDDVYDNINKSRLSDFIARDGKFPVVKGQSVNSKITSIPALQRVIKKALADRLSAEYKVNVLPETGAEYPVRFQLFKDRMTVYLDSSGQGLHKRGYRAQSNEAPIKETLAAGLADIAKIRSGDIMVDPLCGSGTILIEAAYKALGIPPGLNRSFTAMGWYFIPKKCWSEEKEELRAGIKKDADFRAFGYDIDKEAVRLTKENAEKAGVSKYITVTERAVKDFIYPGGSCKIICNPPYAERMLDTAETEKLYKEMGKVFLPRGGHQIYVITANENFESLFGEKASKNRKLYNGMIMCRCYQYF